MSLKDKTDCVIIVKTDGSIDSSKTERPTLQELQAMVGGYIELVTYSDDYQIICNEDGIALNLEHNIIINDVIAMTCGIAYPNPLLGNVVILKGKAMID